MLRKKNMAMKRVVDITGQDHQKEDDWHYHKGSDIKRYERSRQQAVSSVMVIYSPYTVTHSCSEKLCSCEHFCYDINIIHYIYEQFIKIAKNEKSLYCKHAFVICLIVTYCMWSWSVCLFLSVFYQHYFGQSMLLYGYVTGLVI
jgi:hypothetical protein